MFKGFNVTSRINEFASLSNEDFENYYKTGDCDKESSIKQVRPELEKYINANGIIEGEPLQQDWFPEVEADVFISHSHKDVDDAIVLAGWLKENFGLNAFIDSAVWGYADKLLQQLDDKFSWVPESGFYSYKIRNNTTSHVHMMLSMALTKMIDRCEAVFFYNTPNSINSNGFKDTTFSPWIYNELAMTKFIQKKEPIREGIIQESADFKKSFNAIIQHPVDVSGLITLNKDDMLKWRRTHIHKPLYASTTVEKHPLDALYTIKSNQLSNEVTV